MLRKRRQFFLLGPAFIAAIGYIDPGNFATNIEAGASYGYQLLWVILFANLMAMLIQYLSAKLGIITGKNLPEHLRDHLPKWAVVPYWLQAELIAIATDLAEFIGAAVGFQLIFKCDLMQGAIITAVVTFAILMLANRGQKPIEIVIGTLLLIVASIYIVELILARPNGSDFAKGLLLPSVANVDQLYLIAGMFGATVMPHVIYLHSALFDAKSNQKKDKRLEATRADVLIAMTIAGFVNIAIVGMAAAVFHFSGHQHVAGIETAYYTLTPLLGNAAATLFGLSLIASGLSSTVVGTMAGDVVMQGFVRRRIPIWLRRLVTMFPSFIIIYLGINTTKILILSQVILSFGIALALIPLLIFTNNAGLMGRYVNNKLTKITGLAIAIIVLSLNIYLLFSALG